ncbi:MAG: crotonobetainyl-CoA hydratase, partial [Micrococcales bacterium]|nr:crotonobetainyl-CoA hydratase [Micrococcales bacterium]
MNPATDPAMNPAKNSGPVRTRIDGEVLLVTLDRPKANAIDAAVSRALYDALARLRDSPQLRVAVLRGAGSRFFSAGWDLKAAAGGEPPDADWGPGGFAGLTEFADLDKPVIAAVNGLAIGGGFELALAADLIVAADHAEFALPEVRLGLVADSGGLQRLPARIPQAIARELLLTGRRMDAPEAARWGLVNSVVPLEALDESALSLARQICANAPLSIAATLEVLRETAGQTVAAGLATMRTRLPQYAKVAASDDAREGSLAFVERRPAQW